ncbi:hypothetical protein [Streptomyces sp. NPDC057694]|uniref:hypothetical protein n=1 Tax=Streptomyces sp. NPDC057694 TaxID=3346216 RepID=UPI003698269E
MLAVSRAKRPPPGRTVTDRTPEALGRGQDDALQEEPGSVGGRAYLRVRRQNVAGHLRQRLNRDGRGTRVEFHPLNQSQVIRPHVREVSFRTLNVRNRDRMVDAWAVADE